MSAIIDSTFYEKIIELSNSLKITPSENISINSQNTLKRIITLTVKDIKDIKTYKSKIISFFKYDNLKITVAQRTCTNSETFLEAIETMPAFNTMINIIYEQKDFMKPLSESHGVYLYLFNLKSFEKFSKEFLTKKKIYELTDFFNKINIFLYEKKDNLKNNIETSIFSFESLENLAIPEALVNDTRYSNLSASVIPHSIPKEDIDMKKRALTEMLEIFSYKDKDDQLVFQHNKKKSLYVDGYKDIRDNYEELSNLLEYIFCEEKRFWDKLLIAKKNIIDSLGDKKTTSNFEKGFFNRVLDDTKTYYYLYVDEAVENFIGSIKEVVDIQISFSERIETRVKEVTNQLSTETISIIAIVISSFILEDMNYKELVVPIISIIYVACVMYFKKSSGQFNSSEEYEAQVKEINNQFPPAIMENKKIKGYINTILKPQIERLKNLEKKIEMFYIILLFMFSLFIGYQLLEICFINTMIIIKIIFSIITSF